MSDRVRSGYVAAKSDATIADSYVAMIEARSDRAALSTARTSSVRVSTSGTSAGREPLGAPPAAAVGHDETGVARPDHVRSGRAGTLPVHVNIGAVALEIDEVGRTASADLVGERDVAVPCEVRIGRSMPYGRAAATPPQPGPGRGHFTTAPHEAAQGTASPNGVLDRDRCLRAARDHETSRVLRRRAGAAGLDIRGGAPCSIS